MNLLRFVLVKLTLFLILGILLGHALNIHPYIPALLLIPIIVFLGFRNASRKNQLLFGFMTALATIGLGILTVSLSKTTYHYHHYSYQQSKEPQTWHLKIRELLKPNTYSDRYVVEVKAINYLGTSGKLLLNIKSDSIREKLQVDDELLVYSASTAIREPLNPYQFNYKKYLQHLGMQQQITLNSGNYIRKKSPSTTVYGMAAKFRTTIISKLQSRNFGNEELGIIQALLLGQRNDISPETYTDYKNAGAVHILAVSGLHIGVLLMILHFLLQPLESLPHGRKLKLMIIVVLLWGFALLAGLSASIIRAVTMFSFVAYAQYLNRPTSTFNILALSMFFILLVNPMLLFQVGFQMSYAAVFAIVWIYPQLQKWWTPKYSILKYGWQLLSVSIAAQLGVLPISLFYFHQFPALFFISNLAIIPFLGFILSLGILVIVLALTNILPSFLVIFYNGIIHSNTVIRWVARQETFLIKNISFDEMQLVWTFGIIISGVLMLTKKSFQRTIAFCVCVIGLQTWLVFTYYSNKNKEVVWIAHQTKNTVLLHQSGRKLEIRANKPLLTERLVTDYSIGAAIEETNYQILKNHYLVGDKKLYILDSLAIYPNASKIDYILLSQSPDINLERLLNTKSPKMIIADGSNYRSDVEKWKTTCIKNKIPFYFTGEKGAYYFELEPAFSF